MLICSCAVISDHDIELAVFEIMSQPNAPLPTPGVVWRHMSKKLNCCGCVPLAVSTIYEKMESLQNKGLICPCACAEALEKLIRLDKLNRAKPRRSSPTREDLPLLDEPLIAAE